MVETAYCIVPDCEDETDGHGVRCPMHTKRLQRDPTGRTLNAPKAERLSLKDRAIEAHIALDAATEASGEEWAALERARNNAFRAWARSMIPEEAKAEAREAALQELRQELYEEAERTVKQRLVDRIREGQAQARAAGVRVGREPKISAEKAERLVRKTGSISAAASKAGVSRNTLKRALRAMVNTDAGPKTGFVDQHRTDGPRSGG